jgi:hypothetical protein
MLTLICYNEDHDWFSYNGNFKYGNELKERLIAQCDFKELPGDNRIIQKLEKLTGDQIMMLKLCCPNQLRIIYQ